MLKILYDQNLIAIKRKMHFKTTETTSAYWLFFTSGESVSINNVIGELGTIYAWAFQTDEYLSPMNQNIRDYKSAFGKLGFQHLLTNRVFHETLNIGEVKLYFDLVAIKETDLLPFMQATTNAASGYLIANQKDFVPHNYYSQIKDEILSKAIAVDDEIRLLYGRTLDSNNVIILCANDEHICRMVGRQCNIQIISQDEYIVTCMDNTNNKLTPLLLSQSEEREKIRIMLQQAQ